MNNHIEKEAREWLADCVWGDVDTHYIMNEASKEEIVKVVERYYEGGLSAFILASV